MKKIIKKTVKPVKKTRDEKAWAELKELRKALKKAKKSKQKLQQLWYRTKKEHVAQLKDIEIKLKALKKALTKKK